MNKIKWMILNNGGGDTIIAFNTAAEAEAFLLSQSKDTGWLSQWTIAFTSGGEVTLNTSNRIVLRFDS